MSNFKLEFTAHAIKDARKLPKAAWARLKPLIEDLAHTPYPARSKKLQGGKDIYRIRYSTYRVIYKVEHSVLIVLVLSAAHRKDVYRNLDSIT